jgi:hypothetical protein
MTTRLARNYRERGARGGDGRDEAMQRGRRVEKERMGLGFSRQDAWAHWGDIRETPGRGRNLGEGRGVAHILSRQR